MRHGTSGRRGRNRGGNGGGGNPGGGHRNRGGNNRAQVFDSNGPEVRIRGTAYQIQEKYAALAKDAQSAGDYVLSESYLQHAEHYQRIINSWGEQYGEQPRTFEQQQSPNIGNEQPEVDDLGLPGSIIGTPTVKANSQMEDA
ncbi:MAG: DUF4167 domain-containing protein [Alphaproteobacteria bacterium]|nr:DUF4167 domain-containing protein [Alphaproteobacteria bacterium]